MYGGLLTLSGRSCRGKKGRPCWISTPDSFVFSRGDPTRFTLLSPLKTLVCVGKSEEIPSEQPTSFEVYGHLKGPDLYIQSPQLDQIIGMGCVAFFRSDIAGGNGVMVIAITPYRAGYLLIQGPTIEHDHLPSISLINNVVLNCMMKSKHKRTSLITNSDVWRDWDNISTGSPGAFSALSLYK